MHTSTTSTTAMSTTAMALTAMATTDMSTTDMPTIAESPGSSPGCPSAQPAVERGPDAPGATSFAGDRKHGESILGPVEKRLVSRAVHRVPAWLQTHHLTMMTVLRSVGMIAAGWLAASHHPAWLFAMSAMVVAQYGTDALDGAVGRLRETGLIKWGFFMDHFLDLLFAGSFVVAYSFLAPAMAPWFLALLLVTCATMTVSFLSFAATNRFRIAFFGVGPTEVRIGYLVMNAVVFFAGPGVLSWGVPLVVAGNVIALLVVAYGAQKELWILDMEARRANA